MKKPATMFDAMCAHARKTYENCGRNNREACRVLEISYHTLVKYLNGRPTEVVRRKRAEHRRALRAPHGNGFV